jgi:hypothetical protein
VIALAFLEFSSFLQVVKMLEAATILELMVLLTWAALNSPVHINPLFKQVISCQATLAGLITASNISFCLGLLETIQKPTPPLSWFEALPTATVGTWGIYVLVLKKQHSVPLLYIGSGTAANRGVKARLGEYDRGVRLAKYIEIALNNGYKICTKRLLLHCPIPSAANIPRVRITLVAMEAMFAFLFWAMTSRTKDYGYGQLCPWDRSSFEWHGLCSHNPLLEDVSGNFDLSAEQLEAIAAATAEKNRVYQAEYGANQRAKSPERVRALQRKKNERHRPKQKAKNDAARAAKKFHCAFCNVSCRNQPDLTRHNGTPRHLKRVAELSSRSAQ